MLSTPWVLGDRVREGPWVTTGFQEKPPGRDITSGSGNGLCDPGRGRGKSQRNRGGIESWLFLDAQSRKCTESWKAQVSSYRRIFLVCHC